MTITHQEPALSRPPWTGVLHDWVTTVDHKKIGVMYVLVAIVFLLVGGAEALLMRRLQAARATRLFGAREEHTFREAVTKYLNENQHKRSLERDARALARARHRSHPNARARHLPSPLPAVHTARWSK